MPPEAPHRRAAREGDPMTATVLLVEDEPAILSLLDVSLRSKGFVTRQALDAAGARASIQEALPDLVILDWMLPGETGLALARELRRDERTRTLPIIMLTARAQEADKVSGLEAGADDYVTKPFSPRELVARVNAVLRRRAPALADADLVAGALTLNPGRHAVEVRGRPVEMGPVEFRLLAVLAASPGQVFTRAQLLDRVWGDHAFIEERTVDVHVLRLRKALAPHHGEDMVQTVRGVGYRFAPV